MLKVIAIILTGITTMLMQDIINQTIDLEGGYVNHPSDHGGPTKYGITLATYQRVNPKATANTLKDITKEQAYSIYEENYFTKPGVNKLPIGVQDLVFDMNVMHGPVNATRILQKALQNLNYLVSADGILGPQTIKAANSAPIIVLRDAINQERKDFLDDILARNPSQRVFKKGWEARVEVFNTAPSTIV